MEDIQAQMRSILEDPEAMSRIMSIAQSLSGEEAATEEAVPSFQFPDIDMDMVRRITGLVGKSNIDRDQRSLLNALAPYLEQDRIHRLEKAMRAAKLASLASGLLSGPDAESQQGR